MSKRIGEHIKAIINKLTQNELQDWLGIELDYEKYYEISSINLIQNFDAEILYIHRIQSSANFEDFRHAIANCIARHFETSDLKARINNLNDQSLLSEPYCTLEISSDKQKEQKELIYIDRLFTQYDILHKNSVEDANLKELLFQSISSNL